MSPLGLSLWNNTLYGVTEFGGSNNSGFAYSINTNGTGFTILHNFSVYETLSGPPSANMVLCSNLLYGTTGEGGSGDYGTVFAMATNGTSYSIIHNFTNADGQLPRGGVCLSGNKLYGTTAGGGANGSGILFSLNIDGTGFTVLANFSNPFGVNPDASLVLSNDVLYGTASGGGEALGAGGSVFSLQIPSIISSIVANSDGSMTIDFSGAPTSTYLVETATNLMSPVVWQTVSTNTADANGLWQNIDSSAGNSPCRFYRSATATH